MAYLSSQALDIELVAWQLLEVFVHKRDDSFLKKCESLLCGIVMTIIVRRQINDVSHFDFDFIGFCCPHWTLMWIYEVEKGGGSRLGGGKENKCLFSWAIYILCFVTKLCLIIRRNNVLPLYYFEYLCTYDVYNYNSYNNISFSYVVRSTPYYVLRSSLSLEIKTILACSI